MLTVNEHCQRKVFSPYGVALLSGSDYGMKLHCILTYVIHWNSKSTYATQVGYPLQDFRFKEYVINTSNHFK
jgi:hypothetical protein